MATSDESEAALLRRSKRNKFHLDVAAIHNGRSRSPALQHLTVVQSRASTPTFPARSVKAEVNNAQPQQTPTPAVNAPLPSQSSLPVAVMVVTAPQQSIVVSPPATDVFVVQPQDSGGSSAVQVATGAAGDSSAVQTQSTAASGPRAQEEHPCPPSSSGTTTTTATAAAATQRAKRKRKAPIREDYNYNIDSEEDDDEELIGDTNNAGSPGAEPSAKSAEASELLAFGCPRCPARFESRVGLTNHLKLHGANKAFPCSVCDFSCTNRKTMRAHKRIHGVVVSTRKRKSVEVKKPPPIVESFLAPDKRPRHSFPCPWCPFKAHTFEKLIPHKVSHFRTYGFQCPYCTFRCDSDAFLLQHIGLHVPTIPPTLAYVDSECSSKEPIPIATVQVVTDAAVRTAPIRFFEYRKKQARRHVQDLQKRPKNASYVCLLGRRLLFNAFKHLSDYRNTKLSCISFMKERLGRAPILNSIHDGNNDPSDVIRHVAALGPQNLIVEPEKDVVFTCFACPYKTDHRGKLTAHERKHGNTHAPMKCPKCSYSCRLPDSMAKHVIVHQTQDPLSALAASVEIWNDAEIQQRSQELSLRCPLCPYRSKHGCDMKAHSRMHTLKAPFECTFCSYSTHRINALKSHETLHFKAASVAGGDGTPRSSGENASATPETNEAPILALVKQESDSNSMPGPNTSSQKNGDVLLLPKEVILSKVWQDAQENHLVGFKIFLVDGSIAYRCLDCPYHVPYIADLASHRRYHLENGTFRCPKCSFSTNERGVLPDHIDSHLSTAGQVPSSGWECSSCSFQSPSYGKVWCHVQKHNRAATFTCETCQFSVQSIQKYNDHRKLHSLAPLDEAAANALIKLRQTTAEATIVPATNVVVVAPAVKTELVEEQHQPKSTPVLVLPATRASTVTATASKTPVSTSTVGSHTTTDISDTGSGHSSDKGDEREGSATNEACGVGVAIAHDFEMDMDWGNSQDATTSSTATGSTTSTKSKSVPATTTTTTTNTRAPAKAKGGSHKATPKAADSRAAAPATRSKKASKTPTATAVRRSGTSTPVVNHGKKADGSLDFNNWMLINWNLPRVPDVLKPRRKRRRSGIDADDDDEGGKLYECKQCPFMADKRFLALHEPMHAGDRPQKCPMCSFNCFNIDTLYGHLNVHSPVLTESMLTDITKKLAQRRRNGALNEREEIPANATNVMVCTQCNYKTISQDRFIQHRVAHVQLMKQRLMTQMKRDEIQRRTRGPLRKKADRKLHYCTQCSFRSDTAVALMNHQEFHGKSKIFKCQFCDYSDNHKETVTYHEDTHHMDLPATNQALNSIAVNGVVDEELISQPRRKFPCDLCPFYCHELIDYIDHYEAHHSDQPGVPQTINQLRMGLMPMLKNPRGCHIVVQHNETYVESAPALH